MRTRIFMAAALAALVAAAPASAQSRDVDLEAGDGVTLKATYTSPDRPGPGMLLVHQCNMDRTSWNDIAAELVGAGVHVLTLDLRGFGDSGGEGISAGFPAFLRTSAADVDMAYDYLASQSGVDASRIGAGGASCGAMLTADLAARRDGVKALMLLSGPPSEAAVANMAGDGDLAVFAAAATEDPVTVGVADALQGAVDGSPHPDSTAKIYPGPEHGLPMFGKNPDLEPAVLAWLKGELLGN